MSYKEQLQANNTELNANTLDIQTAIDMVNALPEATDNSIETVHITLRLSHGPYWNVAYSFVLDGEIVNRTYFGDGEIDYHGHFSISGTAVYGELDIPKGSFIAIGHEEGSDLTLNVSERVNCSQSWIETLHYTALVVTNIEDGASITIEA